MNDKMGGHGKAGEEAYHSRLGVAYGSGGACGVRQSLSIRRPHVSKGVMRPGGSGVASPGAGRLAGADPAAVPRTPFGAAARVAGLRVQHHRRYSPKAAYAVGMDCLVSLLEAVSVAMC